jgi:hypothetical protein
MSSNKKHYSLGWTLAISLGIACSAGVVHAGNIGDTYTAGDTLTAAKMDTIRNAVNDNDGRITTNTNDIDSLTTTVNGHTTSIGTLNTTVSGHTSSIGTLTTNVTNLQNGTPTCGAGTTAVGLICVDDTRQGPSVTWIDAVNDCRAEGKRLMTPGEYMAAKSLGTITDMNNNGNFEWVDSVSASGSTDNIPTGGLAGRLIVGFMGPGVSPTHVPVDGDIFFSTTATYDTTAEIYIYYRCAR